MPGTQTMANWPGLAWWRLTSLNQKDRIEGVSPTIRSRRTTLGVWFCEGGSKPVFCGLIAGLLAYVPRGKTNPLGRERHSQMENPTLPGCPAFNGKDFLG